MPAQKGPLGKPPQRGRRERRPLSSQLLVRATARRRSHTRAQRSSAAPLVFWRSTNQPVGAPGNGAGRLASTKRLEGAIAVACATPPRLPSPALQPAVALFVVPAATFRAAVPVVTLVAPFVPFVPLVPLVPLVPGIP